MAASSQPLETKSSERKRGNREDLREGFIAKKIRFFEADEKDSDSEEESKEAIPPLDFEKIVRVKDEKAFFCELKKGRPIPDSIFPQIFNWHSIIPALIEQIDILTTSSLQEKFWRFIANNFDELKVCTPYLFEQILDVSYKKYILKPDAISIASLSFSEFTEVILPKELKEIINKHSVNLYYFSFVTPSLGRFSLNCSNMIFSK